MASLVDKKGLEAVSVMIAMVTKFSMDQVVVEALMEAQVLEEKDQVSKERRGLAMLDVEDLSSGRGGEGPGLDRRGHDGSGC